MRSVISLSSSAKEKHEFLVNRKTLRFASPVWKKMLDPDGHFMEHDTTVLSLPDNKPGPMLLILDIAHLRFAKLATVRMNRAVLIDLAILCDKYDMAALVKPFLQTWDRFDAAIMCVKRPTILLLHGRSISMSHSKTSLMVASTCVTNTTGMCCLVSLQLRRADCQQV